MKKAVVLSLCGRQNYVDQEPDTIELVTEGTLEEVNNGWRLCYEESDLTGLQGVSTTFEIQKGVVTLIRTGKLNSEMVFRENIPHDSLYRTEFGALMLTVCATKIEANITELGGSIDLVYTVEIEQNAAGHIEYHLDVRVKE
ncbi:MAG: DUF1934 domain-containing protein [Oscillospiraceae bacterium]|nr:DUF1934 domain-containing protein [Oscillospiraceae bacterium]